MSAILEVERSLSTAEPIIARSQNAVARILHLSHTLEQTRDAFLALLPEADDETVIEVRMSARSVGVWAWLIECACDAELVRRTAKRAGRSKKDTNGEGRMAALGQQAYADGKSVRTIERNAQIINTFGAEKIVTHGENLRDKGFFIAALSAPDPLKAIEMFEEAKTENAFFEVQDAWALVNELNTKAEKLRRKQERKANPKPSELEFIHSEEAQAYLDKCHKALQELQTEIPHNLPSLRILNRQQREQIMWQKNRTVEADCNVILEMFTGDKGASCPEEATDTDIYWWLYRGGFHIDDGDLDDRLELLSKHSVLEQERAVENAKRRKEGQATLPAHKHECTCEPINKKLEKVDQGGRKDTQRGDLNDLYALYGHATGDSASVPRANSVYEMGEPE